MGLQVTALKPTARAMDTYVRPEFERNQAAISRLTQSIQKTNTERDVRQAEVDAVAESLTGDIKDVHDRTSWHSTSPAYMATRYEHRGKQYAMELAPQVLANYEEFKLGAMDNGGDLDSWLQEQFAPAMEALGGNQFLMAGAAETLQMTKNQILAAHPSFLDGRALEETMSHMSMRVDSIVHQSVVNVAGREEPLSFYGRIDHLDGLAVEFEATTPIKKGEGNKIIFDSLLSMAKGAPPEVALSYLELAKQVQYSRGKNGGVRPEAWEALTAVEEYTERRAAADKAVQKQKAKEAADMAKTGAMTTLISDLTEAGGQAEFSPEYIEGMAEKGVSPEKMLATINAFADMSGRKESTAQEESFNALTTLINNNRYNPNGVMQYEQLLTMIADEELHSSRLAEVQKLIQGVERAAPLIQSTLSTAPRNLFVAGLVEMEDEWDTTGKARKAELVKQWDGEMHKLIEAHYEVEGVSKPTSGQLEAMATSVEQKMRGNFASQIAEIEADRGGLTEYRDSLTAELYKSTNRDSVDDGKLQVLGFNNVGLSNLSSLTGNLSADVIESDIMPSFKKRILNNPAGVITAETAQGDTDSIGRTWAEQFDIVYGAGAFSTYYEEYGVELPTMEMYKNLRLSEVK